MDTANQSPVILTTKYPSDPPDLGEIWDQMEARHAKERRALAAALMRGAYRKGLSQSPLPTTRGDSIRSINLMTATKHDLGPNDLIGLDRTRHVCAARHEAWYIQHQEAGHSLPAIASFYNRRDHTTILSGIQRHAEYLARRAAAEGAT